MREASKSLGNDIRKFQKAGDENTARPLRLLKAAIAGDMAALGESAANGSIAVHEGRIVYPQRLQSELDGLNGRIAEEQAIQAPDVVKMGADFNAAGRPYMKINGESQKTFGDRIAADYQKAFPGQDVPTSQTSKHLDDMIGRKAKIEGMLKGAQPAEDAAAAIKNAVGLSKSKFARLCVQRRLACSAGDSPAGVKVRSPVTWIAGWRETKILKPIDKAILRVVVSYRAVTQVNAR